MVACRLQRAYVIPHGLRARRSIRLFRQGAWALEAAFGHTTELRWRAHTSVVGSTQALHHVCSVLLCVARATPERARGGSAARIFYIRTHAEMYGSVVGSASRQCRDSPTADSGLGPRRCVSPRARQLLASVRRRGVCVGSDVRVESAASDSRPCRARRGSEVEFSLSGRSHRFGGRFRLSSASLCTLDAGV